MAGDHTIEPERAANREDWLRPYVGEWSREGIISPEQGEAILSYHNVASEALPVRRLFGRLITVLATLGAILVGVGAILFVGSNWQEIPQPGKLAMILGAIAATYAAGYRLKYQVYFPRVGGPTSPAA